MKYISLIILVISFIVLGSHIASASATAKTKATFVMNYKEFTIGDFHLIRFVDPDNGDTCYLSNNGSGVPISCLKK